MSSDISRLARRVRPALFLGALAAIALVAVPTDVEAQAPTATLKAGYIPGTGTLYLVGDQDDLPDACVRPDEHVLIEWNEEGPIGDQGLPGLACWDVNADGVPDPSEDLDGNSVFDVDDCRGETGPQGEQGEQGPSGLLGLDIINDSSSWTETEESQVYVTTLACELPGQVALSVGVNGEGAMNNVVSIAIVGSNGGYYRIRIKGGSSASEVEAQLVCATVG